MKVLDCVTYAIMNAFFSRPIEEQIFNASPSDNEDLAKAAISAMRKMVQMTPNGNLEDHKILNKYIDKALNENT